MNVNLAPMNTSIGELGATAAYGLGVFTGMVAMLLAVGVALILLEVRKGKLTSTRGNS